ncbi:MAG: hypothetical protein UHO63_00650, partial [Blautia sp.]|nr:hypothetical protein [Blautia sp.]
KLEQDYERLVEQIRIANAQKFGRSREKLNDLVGQLSFFNEAEACCDENAGLPERIWLPGGFAGRLQEIYRLM